jgi:hypothetical protein
MKVTLQKTTFSMAGFRCSGGVTAAVDASEV